MGIKYKTITEAEAKKLYRDGKSIYVTNDVRSMWQIPPSYAYGSQDPIETLFYRGVPKERGEGKNRFFVEWKPEWQIVSEGNDENGNPTIWSMDIRGTEIESRIHGDFIWITLDAYKSYAVEVNEYGMGFSTLKACKTLANAKRWVTMNLL